MRSKAAVVLGLTVFLAAANGCDPECKLVRYDGGGQNPDTLTVEPEGGNCTITTYATSNKDSVGTKPGGN